MKSKTAKTPKKTKRTPTNTPKKISVADMEKWAIQQNKKAEAAFNEIFGIKENDAPKTILNKLKKLNQLIKKQKK